MEPFDQALEVVAGVMPNGVTKHPDNERTPVSICPCLHRYIYLYGTLPTKSG
jgi:hypothetical protein